MTPRRMRKLLKHVNWGAIESGPEDYKRGGEYAALRWLKAYAEGRAACEPIELARRCFTNIAYGISQDPRNDAVMGLELMGYER